MTVDLPASARALIMDGEAREVALDDLRRHGRSHDLPSAIAAALGEP